MGKVLTGQCLCGQVKYEVKKVLRIFISAIVSNVSSSQDQLLRPISPQTLTISTGQRVETK